VERTGESGLANPNHRSRPPFTKTLERMKTVIAILMCVFPTLAYSETFEQRVQIAKAAEVAEAYKPYQQVMYRGIGDACLFRQD
jgi:hypothetical protein